MLFDVNNLFFHKTNAFTFSSGEYMPVTGVTSSGGLAINLGNARDLGIGDGEFIPKVAVYVGTPFTSTCSSLRVNAQFQGSTDSTTWTTYAESGALATSSFVANAAVLPIDIPPRPQGASLPSYYRLNLALTGTTNNETLSGGTLIGGIVIQRDQPDGPGTIGNYPSGFTVA